MVYSNYLMNGFSIEVVVLLLLVDLELMIFKVFFWMFLKLLICRFYLISVVLFVIMSLEWINLYNREK